MIYYCIPTHNEEKTVGVVLWKIRHVMAEFPRDFQILIGDDASTDGSAAILEPYRRVLPVVLMRNAKRNGYAATLEMLLRQAVRMSRYPKRDVIVVVQADFTDDIDGAAAMLRMIESGADIVTGGPVTNSVRPGFFERLARSYAYKLLRKFEWPENADPLNGLNVYRVMCVKRAIEEAGGKRLLAWDGAVANAALLRAALPHARRIESIEISKHTDRAQRQRRFRPLEMISQVRRFAAGSISTSLQAIDAIDPDEVRGDLSVLHGPQSNAHGATDEDAAPNRRAGHRESNRSADRKPARRRPARGTAQTAKAQTATTGTEGKTDSVQTADEQTRESKPRTRRNPANPRPTRKPADSPADQAAAAIGEMATAGDADVPETADKPETSPSRRGRRRGGRGRGPRKPSTADSPGVSGSEDVTVSADNSATPPEPMAAEAGGEPSNAGQGADNEGDTAAKPVRRRRGRRGGRNRRGGRRPSGTNDAPVESGSVPEEPQAEGSG